MTARSIIFAVGAIGIGIATTVLLNGSRQRQRLEAEVARLVPQQAAADRIRAMNAQLRRALAFTETGSELQQRQREIERLRFGINGLELEARALKRELGVPSEPVWPAGAAVRSAVLWAYCGQATPDDTLESVLWTARTGDTEHLADLIDFEPGAKAKAEALFASLPDAARVQYGSPAGIVAALIAAQMPTDYAAMAAVARSEPVPGVALVRLRLLDGSGVQSDHDFKLLSAAGAWRLAVPESVVDSGVAQVRGTAAAK
jgi:hypothetical protein